MGGERRERTEREGDAQELRARQEAQGRIRERFPNVDQITFALWEHERPDGPALSALERTYQPADWALFAFGCSARECGGESGHDVTREVVEAIHAAKTEIDGRHACAGWRDAEHVGRVRCGRELTYRAIITYQPE